MLEWLIKIFLEIQRTSLLKCLYGTFSTAVLIGSTVNTATSGGRLLTIYKRGRGIDNRVTNPASGQDGN